MKTIKKYFKVVFCFLAFAICSLLMAFAPTMTAVSASSIALTEYKNALSALNMKKSVKAEDGLLIPLLEDGIFNGVTTNYSVVVTDPAGTVHECEIDAANPTVSGNYFKIEEEGGKKYVRVLALTNGTYKVVYKINYEVSAGQTRTYYSNAYKINVENVLYKLDFTKADGSKFLLPEEVKTGSDKLEIVIPRAKQVNSEKDQGVLLNAETEVTVIDGNGKTHVLNAQDSLFTSEGEGTNIKYYLNPAVENTYKINFTYKSGVNRPTVTKTVNVTDNYENPTDFKVSKDPTIKVGSNGVELGKKGIVLPELIAKNSVSDDVDYNCESIVIEKEDDSNVNIVLKNNTYTFDMTLEAFNKKEDSSSLAEGDAGFVDSYEDLKGNYKITYNLKDAYGNTTSKTVRIEDVTVSSKPTIKLSYNYDAGETPNTDGAETSLHLKYGYDNILIPAVSVEDNVDENLIVVRAIRNTKTQQLFYVDNLKYNSSTKSLEPVQPEQRNSDGTKNGHTGYNYAADESYSTGKELNLGKINQAVKFKFDLADKDIKDYAGEYQLEFQVISNALGKKRTEYLYSTGTTKYSFEVLDCAIDSYKGKTETDLKVEIGSSVVNEMYVDAGEKLQLSVKASDNDDKRLKTVVYYTYNNTLTDAKIQEKIENLINTTPDDKKAHILENSAVVTAMGYKADYENSKFVVPFEGYNVATHTSATIIAVTYNDYGSVAVDTRTVLFQNTSENVAPSYVVTNGGSLAIDSANLDDNKNTFKIGDVVTLPTVEFIDYKNKAQVADGVHDEILSTNVMYYVVGKNGDNIETKDYRYPTGKIFGNNVVGGTINATEAGQYYVVYTATDDAGNTIVVYFTFYVNDTSKPDFSVSYTLSSEDSEGTTVEGINTIEAELGEEINFNLSVKAFTTEKYEDVTKTSTITVNVDDFGKNLDVQPSGNKKYSYLFNSIGDYTITFTAKYSDREVATQVVNIKIKKPELKWIDEFNVQETAKEDEYVELPYITASHDAKVTVEVKVDNSTGLGEEVAFYESGEGETRTPVWRFKTKDKGTYTVTYKATTDYAELKKEFKIQVGDIVKPTFQMEGISTLEQDILYNGNQIQYKIVVNRTSRTFVVTVLNNGEEVYSVDTKLKVTDLDDSGNKNTITDWSSENFTYKLTGDSKVLKEGDTDGVYYISGAGQFTLTLSIKDKAGNESTKVIKFNVKNELNVEEDNTDTIVGVVLIIVSLIVLAGVILFFTLTGRKQKRSSKRVNNKKQNKKVAEKVEVQEVVEEKVEETEAENTEGEAKSGEIEE